MAVHIQTEMEAMVPQAMLGALTDETRARLALDIASEVRGLWLTLAKQRLRTALATYEAGIQEAHLDGQAAVVALVGPVPNALEHGQPGYDMRTTLLGPGVPIVERGSGRRGKQQTRAAGQAAGYYRSIPFRHQTIGKAGFAKATERFARTMGAAYRQKLGDEEALALGRAVYKAAKALSGSTSEPHRLAGQRTGTRASDGARVRLAPMGRPQYAQRLPTGLAPKLRDHHATDIYAGMIRSRKTYGEATQGSYMTFRTISTRNARGWQAPATPGVQIMQELRKQMGDIANVVIKKFVRTSMGKRADTP